MELATTMVEASTVAVMESSLDQVDLETPEQIKVAFTLSTSDLNQTLAASSAPDQLESFVLGPLIEPCC
jgi:hypothetical protein